MMLAGKGSARDEAHDFSDVRELSSVHAVIVQWLNASEISKFVVGMNTSVRVKCFYKHFERSNGLDIVLIGRQENTLGDLVNLPCRL